MITDRDITVRATAEGRYPKTTLVRDCLSPELVFGVEGPPCRQGRKIRLAEAEGRAMRAVVPGFGPKFSAGGSIVPPPPRAEMLRV